MCTDRGVHTDLLFNFSTKETLTPWFHCADICYLPCASLFCSVFHKNSYPTGSVSEAELHGCLMLLTCSDHVYFPLFSLLLLWLTKQCRWIVSLFVHLVLMFLTLWCSRFQVGTPCYILKIVCWPLHCVTSCLTRSALCWLTQLYSQQSRAESRFLDAAETWCCTASGNTIIV